MEAASAALLKAVKLDTDKEYELALTFYQKGISYLLDIMKDKEGSERDNLRKKIEQYMKRAEEIRNIVYKQHEQIQIKDSSTGHGYKTVFGKYLDERVTKVEIQDAYVREHFQIENLVRYFEMLRVGCKNLVEVNLTTGYLNETQKGAFEQIKNSMKNHGITFSYSFSSTLHDREIKFDSGWVFKIGRGLNYFKKADSKYCLGAFDLNFRKCHETTIDIFHVDKITLQH